MQKLLITLLMLCTTGTCIGQTIEYTAIFKVNASTLTFSDPNHPSASHYDVGAMVPLLANSSSVISIMKPGAEAGLGMSIPLLKKLHFRTGLSLQVMNFKTVSETYYAYVLHSKNGSRLSYPYFLRPGDIEEAKLSRQQTISHRIWSMSIPLLALYNINSKIGFFGGVQISASTGLLKEIQTTEKYTVEKKGTIYPVKTNSETFVYEYHYTESGRSEISLLQLGAIMGANYRLTNELSLEASYQRGLNSYIRYENDLKIKLNSLSFGITYKL
jgi:hypothetical protein